MAIREKANNTALKGGVTEIAGDPNEIEVAGLGRELLKLVLGGSDDMAASITKVDDTLPSKVAPRVPTTIEESFLPPKINRMQKLKIIMQKECCLKKGMHVLKNKIWKVKKT